jgi:hypothetical protein
MATKATNSLTYQQSQAARAALTLSQKNVIDQTGIQAYKIKQFEASKGRVRLAPDDSKLLRDFYESHGVNFDDIDQKINAERVAQRTGDGARGDFVANGGAGFNIAADIPDEYVANAIDRLEENDDRIAQLVATAYKTGFLGAVTDESDAALRELFGTLAESHLLFRFLQGKNVIAPATDDPQTVGDMLSQWFKGSPAYGVLGLTDGDAAQKPQAQAKPKAKTVATADESEG